MRTLLRFDVHARLSGAPRPLFMALQKITERYDSRPFWPKNSYWIFKYTISGHGFISNGTRKRELPPGAAMLLEFPNATQIFGYDGEGGDPWEAVYLEFDGGDMNPAIRELVRRNGPVFELSLESSFVKRLLAYSKGRRDGDSISLDGTEAAQAVFQLLSDLRPISEQRARARNLRLETFCDNVNRNLAKRLSTAKLAKELSVSRGRLHSLVSEGLGCSPHRYIEVAKARHACGLLIEGELTNEEIAENVGLASAISFYRLFKRVVGMTPGEFKNSSRRLDIRRELEP